jgi:hypothetical protein
MCHGVRKRRQAHTLAHSPCLVGAERRAHDAYINGSTNLAYGLWERGLLLQLYFLVICTINLRARILTSLDRNRNTTSYGFSYIYDLSATAKAYLVELGFCLLQLLRLVVVSPSWVPTCSNDRKSRSLKSLALVILYRERANMVFREHLLWLLVFFTMSCRLPMQSGTT